MRPRLRALLCCAFCSVWIVTFFFLFRHERPPDVSLSPVVSYSEGLATAALADVEDAYYRRLRGVHVRCGVVRHLGRAGDGGWDVCLAPAFRPKQPCLVYSFGVNNVWEFDEALASSFGCTVRTFDPSMAAEDHEHLPGPVLFYRTGLGGSDRTLPSGWRLFTFRSLLTRFGEADRAIDLVKIDIETYEWEAFEAMLTTGVLKNVKQLVFETHTRQLTNDTTTKEDYMRYHRVLDGIETLGFRRFLRRENYCNTGGAAAKSVRNCCHELFYVNKNWADP